MPQQSGLPTLALEAGSGRRARRAELLSRLSEPRHPLLLAAGSFFAALLACGVGCDGAQEEKATPTMHQLSASPLPRFLARSEELQRFRAAWGLLFFDDNDAFRRSNASDFHPTEALVKPPRIVAEYEESGSLVLAWPPMGEPDSVFDAIVGAAWGVVPIVLVYGNVDHRAWYRQRLSGLGLQAVSGGPLSYVESPLQGGWVRDYGPVTLLREGADPALSLADFRYYHARPHDDRLPTVLAREWNLSVTRPPLNLEGGNLLATRDGLCLTSRTLWAANPRVAPTTIKALLQAHLGCRQVVALMPLEGEPTGHVDMFAKIASDDVVLVGAYEQTQDPVNHRILESNAALLAATRNGAGRALKVIRVPMPDHDNRAVWRTYLNGLALMRGSVRLLLVPTYSDERSHEPAALAALGEGFEGWELRAIDATALIPWGGAIHCVATVLPAILRQVVEPAPAPLCGSHRLDCDLADCGKIPRPGCCEEQLLRYCSAEGSLRELPCGSENSCGWRVLSGGGWYDCDTEGASEPTGSAPRRCADLPLASGGTEGASPCGELRPEGCCEGALLRFCAQGKAQSRDCREFGPCGWEAGQGVYDCATEGNAAPDGRYPKSCTGGSPGRDAAPGPHDAQVRWDLGPDPSNGPPPVVTGDAPRHGCALAADGEDGGGWIWLAGLVLLGLRLRRRAGVQRRAVLAVGARCVEQD